MKAKPGVVAFLSAFLGSCGAVEVPVARTYRLPLCASKSASRPPVHVLRVQDLRLAAHVSPDHVMVADGPSLVQLHQLDQWAGPLDRMLTDVVVSALRRSGGFLDVKASTDVGREDLWLAATITEFHYARQRDATHAVVAFDAQVRRASDHALVWAGELTAQTAAKQARAGDAVQALGVAVQAVVEQLVAACGTLPAALDGPVQLAAPRDLATPPDGR